MSAATELQRVREAYLKACEAQQSAAAALDAAKLAAGEARAAAALGEKFTGKPGAVEAKALELETAAATVQALRTRLRAAHGAALAAEIEGCAAASAQLQASVSAAEEACRKAAAELERRQDALVELRARLEENERAAQRAESARAALERRVVILRGSPDDLAVAIQQPGCTVDLAAATKRVEEWQSGIRYVAPQGNPIDGYAGTREHRIVVVDAVIAFDAVMGTVLEAQPVFVETKGFGVPEADLERLGLDKPRWDFADTAIRARWAHLETEAA